MDWVWEGSVPDRGEGKDLDCVGLWGHKVLNGGDQAVLDIMDLPLIYRPWRVHSVVHTVAFHLQKKKKKKKQREAT